VASPNDEASASDASVELVSTLCHLLLTPLAGIVLSCDVLRARPPSAAALDEGLTAIERSARTQAALLDNLLELARLEVGSTELYRSRVDLVACVEDVIVRNAGTSRQRHVTLGMTPTSGAWFVDGDPVRLRTAVHNLVDNALRSAPAGTEVSIAVEGQGARVAVHVTDAGQGIAADALAASFAPRALSAPGFGRRSGGLGLGLPVARRIAEVHGGALFIENRAPRGTRATIELPMAAQQGSARPR
jgi:signal transduction histidine kinase